MKFQKSYDMNRWIGSLTNIGEIYNQKMIERVWNIMIDHWTTR